MKEFTAMLNSYPGDKHKVVVQVEQQDDLVNITINVSGKKTTLTLGDGELPRIRNLKNNGRYSRDYFTPYSVRDGKEYYRITVTAYRYSVDGMWMTWKESWQDGLVFTGREFLLSMDDHETTEFLNYIIELFTK